MAGMLRRPMRAWKRVLDPLDHRVFPPIFGQIMFLLIALEFKHSITKVVAHRESITQVKTVLLIAPTIVALAAVVVALGIAYWLIRDRDQDVVKAD